MSQPDITSRLWSLIRQIQGEIVRALGGNRVIRGVVTSAGAITAGEGFSVNHSGTGLYVITFDDAFDAVPAFVATPLTTGNNASLELTAASASSVTVVTFTTATGTSTNFAFHFVAVG